MLYEIKDNTCSSEMSTWQMVIDLLQYKNNKGDKMITRETIVNAVVETVEDNIRSEAPKDMSSQEVDAMLTLGRQGLVTTAQKIADKLLNKNV
jgi:hypothetical protein